jgi:outer membrane lipoprotein
MKERGRCIEMKNLLIAYFLSLLVFSGCAHIISPELKREICEEITLSRVAESPGTYKGKVVLWGGKIIRTVNKEEGTQIEVLQLPLDINDRPKKVDASEGRFLILYPDYLDAAIYRQGRDVTVVGEIQGVNKLPLGEIEYTYPFLKSKKIHLWKARPESVDVYHHFPYHYPFGWGWYPPYCW